MILNSYVRVVTVVNVVVATSADELRNRVFVVYPIQKKFEDLALNF
jgi:hypothetical protein